MVSVLQEIAFGFLQNRLYITIGSMAVAWVILCRGVTWKKGSRLRNLLQFLAMFYLLWTVTVLARQFFEQSAAIPRITAHAVITLIYVNLYADCHKQAKMLLWCSLYAGICCIQTISGQVTFLMFHYYGVVSLDIALTEIFSLMMVPLAIYLRQFNFGNFELVPKPGYWLVLAGDVSIFALTAVEMPWMKTDYRIVITLLAGVACVFMMVLVSIFVIYTMCVEKSEIIALQAEKQRLQSERDMASMMEKNLEDLRCIRHDLKNQYSYIQILLESGRNEEALLYFRQLSENMPAQLNYVDCGNRSMNTILNMEITKAQKAGIVVEHQLVVPPVLPFADDDLCAILANLLDNAIEECIRLRCEGRADVCIKIEIYPKRSYLFIVCHNSTDRLSIERCQKGLRTTKQDPHLHGFGTRIVAKVSEKYNGCTEYSLENGTFTAMVMLDMMQKEET